MARVRALVLPEGAVVSGAVVLPEDVGRHVRDVLRLKPGAPVQATDGAGRVALGVVDRVDRRAVAVTLGEVSVAPPPPGPSVTLLQGVAKGDKLETVVRQTVELGVRVVQPVLTERSVGHRESRAGRLRAIAEDALRISGRAWRPEIRPVAALPEALALEATGWRAALALGGRQSLPEALLGLDAAPDRITLLVGPEGGLTATEVEQAEQAGFVRAHLGPHTLRTETAGPAVVAAVMALSGAWATR